jgi:hypothetical protein
MKLALIDINLEASIAKLLDYRPYLRRVFLFYITENKGIV